MGNALVLAAVGDRGSPPIPGSLRRRNALYPHRHLAEGVSRHPAKIARERIPPPGAGHQCGVREGACRKSGEPSRINARRSTSHLADTTL